MKKTTYALEMTSQEQLKPKRTACPGLRIERAEVPCAELSKFLHTAVGHPWRWGGRWDWDRDDWERHAARKDMETWVAYLRGTPAGYFELSKGPEGDVQIMCFGLLPQFIGKGLGGQLLTAAVERAWEIGASRVWLRTCSHDHPHALENYLARGFRIVDQVEGPPNPPIKSIWD